MNGWMDGKKTLNQESGDSSPGIRRGRVKKERTEDDGCNDRRAKNEGEEVAG